MGSLKEIQEQIESVKSTAQITEAMQLVSASRMQKAQNRVQQARPYIKGIYELVNKIGAISGYESVYLRKSNSIKNIAIVVVGTSRGFVGSLLANLTNQVYKLTEDLKKEHKGVSIKGISIHKTAQRILQNAGLKSDFHFEKYIDNPTTTDLTSIFELLVKQFDTNEFDEIYLVYTEFVNTVVQTALSKKILPLSIETINEESKEDENSKILEHKFEPSPSGILDRLLPEYFQSQIFLGILESIASEHSARMVAMKNATDNSKELKKKLTLRYNRQRQANITQEIIEVINGAKKE